MAINRTTIQQILDTVQELHNLEQIVTRRLSDAQQVQATYSITHPWLPFGLNDVVTATFPRRNETVRATVQRQTINLGEDSARVRSVLLKVA